MEAAVSLFLWNLQTSRIRKYYSDFSCELLGVLFWHAFSSYVQVHIFLCIYIMLAKEKEKVVLV